MSRLRFGLRHHSRTGAFELVPVPIVALVLLPRACQVGSAAVLAKLVPLPVLAVIGYAAVVIELVRPVRVQLASPR